MDEQLNNVQNPVPQSNQTQMIAGAIIVAGIIIAGAVMLKGSSAPVAPSPVPGSANNTANMEPRPVSADEHIIGSADAKVVIIEYSDTECPYCKSFHNTLHSVIAQNGSDVAWVYRHYPIAQLHPKAFHEAEATECAWEQGGNDAFWKYTDQVFTKTLSNNKLDVAELPKIAQDIGLNLASFNTCLASSRHAAKIEADMADGNNAGAQGTPYSVLVTKNNISAKVQSEIDAAVNTPGRAPAVSFSSTKKNMLSLNGALSTDTVNKIISILLK